ncbi:MAG TPA: DUF2268 domain-containing putative Zn-dependent protease [Thermoanaerobaculia bacterium]|nr:DUF2268 domain-containing putative Zn-dependent protease [Thermoanaerobaculia bacterium]
MIAATVLALAITAPPPSSPCAATDLMPAFWKYRDEAKALPLAEQERLFEERVVRPNAAVYAGVFDNVPKPVPQIVGSSLEKLPEFEADMRALSTRLGGELPEQIARFREAFPKFRCDTAVYFLYSAGAFDGATRPVSGKDALMFGLDVIAKLKEPLPPLFAHELFHVYHAERILDAPKIFYWQMWEEGLASYVSRRLNPDVPESQVCCLPKAEPIDAARAKVVSGALERIDSSRDDDYARYFLGRDEALDIPSRSGYLLGYRIAEEAGKTRTLEELADLRPAQVRELVKSGLERMETGTH